MRRYSDLKFKKDKISFLKEKLRTKKTWAIRGLMRIYEFQSEEEQYQEDTVLHNNVGFTAYDAYFLTSLAKQVDRGSYLSEKQIAILMNKMPKYAKQLMKIADGDQ